MEGSHSDRAKFQNTVTRGHALETILCVLFNLGFGAICKDVYFSLYNTTWASRNLLLWEGFKLVAHS